MENRIGEWDYIVVGAGSAGCLVANRLSADPKVKVLLLEAGGKDDWHWIKIPLGFIYCMGNPRADWCYHTEPDPGLSGRSIPYPRGRVLGGSSSINAMLHLRGQKRDYDEWAEITKDSSWSWEKVLPFFKRSENYHGGADAVHGASGEWRVERPKDSWEILDAIRDAMVQAGIPKIEDFNRGDNEGCGHFEADQRRGVRESSSTAFLKPIMNSRSNLTVMTGAQCSRIRIEGKRAKGVEFIRNGKKQFASARAEVILSAGSIGSTQILQLSGIGPGKLLHSLGIPVVDDRPGVGENLQDHLQLRMIFKVSNVSTLNEKMHSFWHRMAMRLRYELFHTGPYSSAPSQLGAFTRSNSRYKTANIEYHVQNLSLDRPGAGVHPFPAFTASPCDLRPTSRGFVRIQSSDPQTAPQIMPNYLSTPEDCKVAVESLRLTRKIVSQPALAKYKPEEYKPGIHYQTDEEILQGAREIGTTIFHPIGTCKMGLPSDKYAVVDSHLRVLGIEGLRVVDASIMPTMTSGNTNAPTLMIAEKASEMIRKKTV